MILPSFSNQTNEIFVSSLGFQFSMTSKGEIQFVVTKGKYDGEDVVYTSCTFPLERRRTKVIIVVRACPLWPLQS